MNSPSHPAALDPITEEIIRGNLIAITDEMKTNLMRTAYNQIIYEAQDFTVGLFDAEGETVSIGLGLPMFVGGLSATVKAKIAYYRGSTLEPGDIVLTNDAYVTGSHLNHMTFTVPIFHEGHIIAYASSMAHWLDVGGVVGSTTTDIYAEGLQVPFVKIFKAGVQDEELTRLIEMNVRFSDLALGDLRAQIASIRTGETRVRGLIERYGADALESTFARMYRRSADAARAVVRRIPDGRYFAEAFMDDDGVDIGKRIRIAVTVDVDDDRMTIDLSDVGPEVAGYYNAGETAGRSAAQVAFKMLTSPQDYPVNSGAFEPVEIVLPPGRVVSAQRPAAMRWWMTYPMTVVDCILRAVGTVSDDGGIAGHHADLAVTSLYGNDPAGGRFFMFMPAPQGGGWGARRGKDGENATICVNDGDTHNAPIEANETKYGTVARAMRYGLRPDSGGAGKWRGGLGTIQEWEILAPCRLNSFIERTVDPPWGVAGGMSAAANRIRLRRAGEDSFTEFPTGKLDSFAVGPGDRLIVETGGGGGYGNPAERERAAIETDLRLGLISPDAARKDYGYVSATVEGAVDA